MQGLLVLPLTIVLSLLLLLRPFTGRNWITTKLDMGIPNTAKNIGLQQVH